MKIERVVVFWNEEGYYEGNMFTKDGQIAGATGPTLFGVIDYLASTVLELSEERESNP